jgi:shikimate dehydrogenase
MDRYAVMGNPVAHSLSPLIHGQFAAQTGQDISYEAILVPLEGFQAAVQTFQAEGGKGLNVTVPFKEEAWRLADEQSERARRARAVNTLVLQEDGRILGENTDGVGLLRDLTRNHEINIKNRRILILGAGGAVRGVLAPLLGEAPAEIRIANRTPERALQLVEDFRDLGQLRACSFEELDSYQADIIINGTSAGLSGELPPISEQIFAGVEAAYDMMYSQYEPTDFQCWAEACGASLSLDGLGMLVEQAAESFYIWRGIRPDTQTVIQSLR